MRFTPQFLDEIRARLPVSQVVARKVALKKAGREYRGLSPFKAERTPSFFVNDQKGFYHCFASGAHGDIFKFVMETEGLSFTEAVERLAEEAGLPLPKAAPSTPESRERSDQQTRLYEILEASARFFEEQLRQPLGQEARAYIERRGLKRETLAEFRIGFAPPGRSTLKEHLAGSGFAVPDMIAAGMLIGGDDIPVPYDRFRGRVMFPIQDAKGRIIAFGGRALDPNAPAKYLNSPETPLFHKGHVLFNAHRARARAYDKGRVIAVEGYMDAISLFEAGFGETVAPLGTALTEAQIQLLWRLAPEPILCFDGDSAGRRAAFRAAETVLPHLKPGMSVRFAFLPDGLDPDDLIRSEGPAAFEAVLQSRVRPLFDVLMEKELQTAPAPTPEGRAALEQSLVNQVRRIADPGVRSQYETELRQTLWERNRREMRAITGSGGSPRDAAVAGRRRNNAEVDWRVRARSQMQRPGERRRGPGSQPPAVTASNELAQRSVLLPPREALILATLINHPWLIEDEAELISGLTFTSQPMARLRDALLTATSGENALDTHTLSHQLDAQGLAKVIALVQRAITHKGDKFADPEADRAVVELGWRHTVALHQKQVELRLALSAAEQAWHDEGSEDAFARICEIQAMLNRSDGAEAHPAQTTD
jgi:DNA primase